jgi:hypothetical protein
MTDKVLSHKQLIRKFEQACFVGRHYNKKKRAKFNKRASDEKSK